MMLFLVEFPGETLRRPVAELRRLMWRMGRFTCGGGRAGVAAMDPPGSRLPSCRHAPRTVLRRLQFVGGRTRISVASFAANRCFAAHAATPPRCWRIDIEAGSPHGAGWADGMVERDEREATGLCPAEEGRAVLRVAKLT